MTKPNYTEWDKGQLISQIKKLEKRTPLGLVWEQNHTKENLQNGSFLGFPVLEFVPENDVITNHNQPTHILIEGENFHSLSVLNYTHEKSIDVIYIDPPYNTGEDEFKFNDKFVDLEDSYRHSKWLSFMDKRLRIAHKLLNNTGIIIIHIDEHEVDRLYLLLCDIFREENDLGRIIWDKRNPKGDSRGVSILHETILCFAKNKYEFLNLQNTFTREKPNARKILAKASALYNQLGNKAIPDDIRSLLGEYKIDKGLYKDFKIEFSLETINYIFQKWINKQDFSGGEKAYKFIDNNGAVFQSVSMAWPNKKKAPDEYFTPLIHPITNKPCPIPARGWRYPISTMQKLVESSLIIFGDDENTQPRRKYLLEENLFENIPSIFSYGGSDDTFQENIGISFPYSKPLEVALFLLSHLHPEPKIILDFFAGSGTTGHAVLCLNNETSKNAQFILCTNNENKIAETICYPRIKKVIQGYEEIKTSKFINGLGNNLRYMRTAFVPNIQTDENKEILTKRSVEMLCLKENAYELVKSTSTWKIFKKETKFSAILFDQSLIPELITEIEQLPGSVNVYIFSLEDDNFSDDFSEMADKVNVCSIPEPILKIYRSIYK